MDIDLLLTISHHLLVFLLVAIVAAEFMLLRPGLDQVRIRPLAGIDAAYGAVAVLVVVVGGLRVVFGASGWDYYAGNSVFWGKMAAFVVMGLLTVQPTLAIRRWHKAMAADAGYAIAPAELKTSRRYLHLQAGVLVLILVFAAALGRGYGVS